jgi:hypothetical protein
LNFATTIRPQCEALGRAEAATYFNFNLAAMDASLDFVLRVGPESVREHNGRLIEFLFERLPKDCILAKSGGRDQFIEVIEMTAQSEASKLRTISMAILYGLLIFGFTANGWPIFLLHGLPLTRSRSGRTAAISPWREKTQWGLSTGT